MTDWKRIFVSTAGGLILAFGVVAFFAVVVHCAAVKQVARTVNDVAQAMCEVYATDNTDRLDGISPEAWCGIARNLDPFLSEALASKQALQRSLGGTAGGECPDLPGADPGEPSGPTPTEQPPEAAPAPPDGGDGG